MLVPLAVMLLLTYAVSGYIGLALAGLLFTGLVILGRLSLRGKCQNCHPIIHAASKELIERLHSILERANLRDVEIYALEEYIPNAYSYGRRVVLSLGLFEILDDEEIAAVVAHELGHIKNRDTFLFPLVAYVRIFAFLMPFLLLALTQSFWITIGGFALYLWFELERSKFLRSREFKADDVALRLLEKPLSLKAALEELKYYEDLRARVKSHTLPGIEPTIDRPFQEKRNYWRPSFLIFPTHPTYEERIFRIVAYSSISS